MEEFSLFDSLQQPSSAVATSAATAKPGASEQPSKTELKSKSKLKPSSVSPSTQAAPAKAEIRAAVVSPSSVGASTVSSLGKGGKSPRGEGKNGASGRTGDDDIDGDAGKQRRLKWVDAEIETLWTGIYTYGNEWREIQKTLPGRTYHQVKDKGRRLLHKCGWSTGRTKSYSEGAKTEAKVIAGEELSKLTGKKVNKKRKHTRQAKGGQSPRVKRPSPSNTSVSSNGSSKGHIRKALSTKSNDINGFDRVFGVPLQENYLVGMNERVENLRLAIANGAKAFPSETTMVQIEGDFGAGKSALVKDYVHKFQDFYTGGVYWVDACLYSRLKSELSIMASKYLGLKLPQDGVNTAESLLAIIWKALEGYSKWLIVFDNVQDDHVLRLAKAPQALKGKGTVLILCEEADKTMLGFSTVHTIPPLTSAECVTMLQDLVGIPESKLTKGQKLSFHDFVNDKSVRGMPGSVRITGLYLAKFGTSGAETFLETLKTLRYDLDMSNHNKYFAGRVLINTNANLYETFGRSNLMQALWNQIRAKLDKSSIRLLELCSLLCPTGIATSILVRAIGPNSQSLLATPTGTSTAASERLITDAIQQLDELSLVLSDEAKTKLTVSSCIQNAVIQTLVREKRFFEVAYNVFECFEAIHSVVAQSSFLPHLSSVVKRIEHLLNFDATDSDKRSEVAAKVKQFAVKFKKELAEDGILVDRITQSLSNVKLVGQPSAVDRQGLRVVKQIEALLKAEDGSEAPSAIANTFTARV